MAGCLIDAGEVEEIVPVLLDMLLEHDLITEEQVDQIMQAIFKDYPCLGEYSEGDDEGILVHTCV